MDCSWLYKEIFSPFTIENVVVQLLNDVQLFCNPLDCNMLGFLVLFCLPEFAQVHVLWVGDIIQPSHPLSHPLSSCSQVLQASGSFAVRQRFTSGGQSYWSFSFTISPSNKYSGLISFRIGWGDLLAVQRILKSLLQHHNL